MHKNIDNSQRKVSLHEFILTMTGLQSVLKRGVDTIYKIRFFFFILCII